MGKDKKRREENDTQPLPRLVLKVGGKQEAEQSEEPTKHKKKKNRDGDESSSHHHKKHKKKHKHKHKSEESASEKKARKREAPSTETMATTSTETMATSVTTEETSEPPVKKIKLPREKSEKKKEEILMDTTDPLRLCLENLHRTLQRKDVYGIFTNPVTDLIAPGYSTIIQTPMDFFTMIKKIESGEYPNIEGFKEDFVVMCNNALKYNSSDTIYYKSAEKMLSTGLNLLTKDKIKRLQKAIGQPVYESEDDVIDVDQHSDVNVESADDSIIKQLTVKKKLEKQEKKKRKERESTKQQQITNSILQAAQEAREKLTRKHPNQKYGYLSKDDDGKTSLNILNPGSLDEKQEVTLGKIAGKLSTGITLSQSISKDDKKTVKSIPVNYLIYGPFGSFGPSYDSSLSTTTKEENELLNTTYGTADGALYAKSLRTFCEDSPFALDFADRLLNLITEGAHTKYINREPVASQPIVTIGTTTQESARKDVNAVVTLDQTIASSKSATTENKSDGVADKLSENAELLVKLRESQHERLTQNLPPSQIEQQTATSLSDNLLEMMRLVAPKDIVSSLGVRKAIGENSGAGNLECTENMT